MLLLQNIASDRISFLSAKPRGGKKVKKKSKRFWKITIREEEGKDKDKGWREEIAHCRLAIE